MKVLAGCREHLLTGMLSDLAMLKCAKILDYLDYLRTSSVWRPLIPKQCLKLAAFGPAKVQDEHEQIRSPGRGILFHMPQGTSEEKQAKPASSRAHLPQSPPSKSASGRDEALAGLQLALREPFSHQVGLLAILRQC